MKMQFVRWWTGSIAMVVCLLGLVACTTQVTPEATSLPETETTEIVVEASAIPDTELTVEVTEVLDAEWTLEELQALGAAYADNCDPDPITELGPNVVLEYPAIVAWLEFIYLNCATTNGNLIWEQWATNVGVYQPDGTTPPAWGTAELTNYALLDSDEISGHRATTLDGEPILYEIRMNEFNYDYIVQRQLYNRDCQIAFFEGSPCDGDNTPVAFPWQAVEIKTAWVILQADAPNIERYYTISTTYVDRDGNTQAVLAGLAGLHFSSKVLPNWFWATFEQVDNATATGIEPVEPIAPDAVAANTEYQQILALYMPDLPWQYYQLRGTQTAFTNPDGTPSVLANTLIETDFQNSSSCITCHALATRGSQTQGRLAFFNITDEGMQGYIGDVAGQAYFDSFGDSVCYEGTSDYFNDCASGQNVYRQLDFVWSLREAE
jgi:hypothetical protein